MNNDMGPPSLFDTMSEGGRTLVEYFAGRALSGLAGTATPQGYGQPVLVFPGLGGGDITTKPLRNFLTKKGYAAHGWNGRINTGPDAATLAHLKARLEDVYAQSGGKKVALIGHSLGGIYARELARAFPEKVSRVITLGTPFGIGQNKNATEPMTRKLFEAFNGANNPLANSEDFARQSLIPPEVPTTSIYTRNDGVVNWRACINPKAVSAENVEIYASHCGLVVNPVSFLVIADRLAEDVSLGAKRWRPFEFLKYPEVPFRIPQAHAGREPVAAVPAAFVKLFT
ncbi:MAG: PGAP1-like family protein [Micavibrio sp.]|nr:PGAP1-like family protein [Micavibrio sp.]